MWVRKLSGKQTGLLIEMQDHAAEAEIATGVAERAESPDEPENDLLAELLEAEAASDAELEVEAAEDDLEEDASPERKRATKRRRKSAS